jgi:hypothetical protein
MSDSPLFADILGNNNGEDDPKKKAVASTGQLFSDILTPSSNQTPVNHVTPKTPIQDEVDNPATQLVKSFGQGLLALPKTGAEFGSHVINDGLSGLKKYSETTRSLGDIMSGAANLLNKANTKIEPNVDPKHPITSAIAQTVGETAGQMAVQVGEFAGARKVVNVAIDALPSPLVSNATKAIGSVAGDIGTAAEKILPTWMIPQGATAKIIAKIPKNVSTAFLVGVPNNQDPMQSLAFGFLGAAQESGFGMKGYNPNAAAPVGSIKPQLPPHSQRIQDRLGSQSELRGDTWESLMGKIKDAPNKFRQELVDRTSRIRQIETEVGGNKNSTPAADAARLAAGIPGKIKTFLEDQPFAGYDANGDPMFIDAPSVKDILKEVGPEGVDALNRVSIAARVLDEKISSQYQQGSGLQGPQQPFADNINTGIGPDDAHLELAHADPDIIQAATHLTDNANAALSYAVNRGRIDGTLVNLWRKVGESYIPLNRIFDSPEPISQPGKSNNASNYKSLKGSEELIGKPSETIPEYISRTIRGADMNYVWNTLADVARANPIDGEKWMSQVEYGTLQNSPVLAGKANALMTHYNATNPATPMTIQQALGLVTTFHNDVFDAQSNTLTIYNKGMLERWNVHPQLAQAIKTFNPIDSELSGNILAKAFQIPSMIVKKGMQAGITKNPAFAVFHGIADTFLAKLNTKYGFEFGKSSLDGFFEAVKKGEEYQKFMASGGGGSVFSDYNSKYSLDTLQPRNGFQSVVATITHPIEALGKIAQPIYVAAKLGEFMKGTASGISSQQAALAARNVTPDMGQIGGSMKFLSSIDAFVNPAIQHFDNFYQNVKSQPKQVFATGVASITLPSVALWFANRNDKEINDIRKTQGGANYWYIRLADNSIGRVKKPYLPGYVFGTLAEEALDEMVAKSPDTIEQAHNSLAHEFSFSFIPQAVQLAAGLWANKDYYSGNRIIPQGMEGIDPSQQKLPNTSKLASTVADGLRNVSGNRINLSPIQIDYSIRGATGDIGVDISHLVGIKKDINGPTLLPAQWPVIGKFLAAYPTKSVEPLSTFYAHADKVDEVSRTIKYMETKNPLALEKYLKANENKLALAPMFTEGKAQLGKLNQELAAIMNMPDKSVSQDYKRDISNHYIKAMIEIARNLNNAAGSTGLLNK